MNELGEALTRLPWLAPRAGSLRALARAPDAAWEDVRDDPAAVLLLARFGGWERTPTPSFSFALACREAGPLTEAARLLVDPAEKPHPVFVDWTGPDVAPVHCAAVRYATRALELARSVPGCDPQLCWGLGLLLPLGWFLATALDRTRALDCLHDSNLALDPSAVQQRHWGLDASALARRALRQWRVSPPLATLLSHVALPFETARALGCDPVLLSILQLAIYDVERQGNGLHLRDAQPPNGAAEHLGLSPRDLELPNGTTEIAGSEPLLPLSEEKPERVNAANPAIPWSDPHSQPMLVDLLTIAAQNRLLRSASLVERLEAEVDTLHEAVVRQQAQEADRLQAQKLAALAEFAAGAGHEINNPLAVISGQAQYLLTKEDSPDRQRSLYKIIGQTQRVNHILNDLMQFARPPRPRKHLIDMGALLADVAAQVGELAEQRRVQVAVVGPSEPVALWADGAQVKAALSCLLRNAVEAAQAEGWARLRVEVPGRESLRFVVEDSGAGLTSEQREHLFDPFFSGRLAGRGRGLGLPTAWRLARENGGDVRLESRPSEPTRFVLSLPQEAVNGSPHILETIQPIERVA